MRPSERIAEESSCEPRRAVRPAVVEALNGARRAIALAAVIAGAGCGAMPDDADPGEPVGEAEQELEAHCSVKVNGVGTIDVEKNYLPHVIHCENGGAPFEALKAQAIAARTYLYYRLASVSSIDDGQNEQVYSCGSGPTAAQIKAVEETAGQVLRHGGLTLCSFFVAGDPTLAAPGCMGSDADAGDREVRHLQPGALGERGAPVAARQPEQPAEPRLHVAVGDALPREREQNLDVHAEVLLRGGRRDREGDGRLHRGRQRTATASPTRATTARPSPTGGRRTPTRTARATRATATMTATAWATRTTTAGPWGTPAR
jgi:hypothetical protein